LSLADGLAGRRVHQMERSRGEDQAQRPFQLLGRVKTLATKYYRLTRRSARTTSEVARYAAVLPREKLSPVRQSGYDATRRVGRCTEYLQIKHRPEEAYE
jgi:hypothetical protein